MSELKVGDWLYQYSRWIGLIRRRVDRLTPKYGILDNGDKVRREMSKGNDPTYNGLAGAGWYRPETPELKSKYEHEQLCNKAWYAIKKSKLPIMSTEDLTTIINIFNKY